MTVQDMIDLLSTMPSDAILMKSNTDGCEECNPDGLENLHEPEYPVAHEAKLAPYPNNDNKKRIVII